MKVREALRAKGAAVMTVRPDETVERLAHRLRLERVGAMIVSDDGVAMIGIVSERDVVQAVAERGAAGLTAPVSAVMTRGVHTCRPEDSLALVARRMTDGRFRHMPVVEGGRVIGMISIGDVVKHRLAEVELEAEVLRDMALSAL